MTLSVLHRLRFALALASAVAVVAGCSTWQSATSRLPRPGVYKLDINQGNYITQDMVEKLKPGQTRQQVRTILGTPLLSDPFHAERWDYVYHYARDGRTVEQRKFTVFFDGEKLARWEGDDAPVSAAQLNRLSADRALRPQAPADERGFWDRLREIFKVERQ